MSDGVCRLAKVRQKSRIVARGGVVGKVVGRNLEMFPQTGRFIRFKLARAQYWLGGALGMRFHFATSCRIDRAFA